MINTDKTGDTFADASYAVHGTNAYAFGLKVDNAREALARATALGAPAFSEERKSGEVTVPAVQGVGNGVIYFLDDTPELAGIWEREFSSLPVETTGAKLTRIDHLAQTTQYQEMLTWLLFYHSIFSVRRTPMVDVVDPGGLVRSRRSRVIRSLSSASP